MKRAAKSIVKLGLIQTSVSARPEANLKKTLALVERAAKSGAQIICTQELFRSQYFCQSEDHANFKLAEKIPGPSTDAFCRLAKKHQVVIIASLFEKRASGIYHNTAAVIDADGSLLGIYRKMHIPDDPLFYEKFYFTPGDLGFKAWQTKLCQNRRADLLGPVVSRSRAAHRDAGRRNSFLSDRHRLASRRKEKIRLNQHGAWETIQRAHAVANGCYVAVANRIGHEILDSVGGDGIEFWGQSFVAGTSGEILAKAGAAEEEILLVPVDLASVDATRTHWPFLRDRRIDAYGNLTRRFVD